MAVDPRLLANELNDLREVLFTWSVSLRETLQDARTRQQQIAEQVSRVSYYARIRQTEQFLDQESVQHIDHELSDLLLVCAQVKSAARDGIEQTRQASAFADHHLHLCQEQLQVAQIRMKQAQESLLRAREAQKGAQAQLKVLLRSLQDAERALAFCRNQNNKEVARHCQTEERTVLALRARTEAAKIELQKMIYTVQGAEAKVELAQKRIAACNDAITYTRQAVALAQLAQTHAQQAYSLAEQSVERGETVQKNLVQAKAALVDEEEAVRHALMHIASVENSMHEASVSFQNTEHFEASVQRYSSLVSQELHTRIEALLEFNRQAL